MDLNIIMSLITTIVTLIVGVVLYAQINSQKDTISNMKTLIDSMKAFNEVSKEMYNPNHLKTYKEVIEKNAESKYSNHLETKLNEEIKKIDKEAMAKALESYIQNNVDFLESYEEVLSIPINILREMDKEKREEYLAFFPKNKQLITRFLEAIEKGDIKPGSSVIFPITS